MRSVSCCKCSGDSVGESKSISNEEMISCWRKHRHHSELAILLLIATCILSPIHNAHAYSPTAYESHRIHHRGGTLNSISYQHRTYHVSSSQLFSTNDDTILERTTASDATMLQEEDQNIIDTVNILQVDARNTDRESQGFGSQLSSSTMVSTTNARRTINRKMTGLPLDSDIPLFQSSPNNQLSKEYNNLSTIKTEETSWKDRLIDVSNLASLLCVLDCTLLPFVSIAIPALSWGVGIITGSAAITSSNPIMTSLSSFMTYLPAISHGIALYFVIPVALLTTIFNYFFGHKEIRFSLMSMVGVALIYAANGSGVGVSSIDTWLNSMGIVASAHTGHGAHVHDMCGAVVGAATGMMAHTCPEGLAHRMTNTLGCAFLLGSNYASKKYMENKSESGCAASALAEAWGSGDSGGKKYVCPPGCSCESPKVDEELFFQWNMSSRKGMRGRKGGSRSFNSRRP